MDQSHQTFSSAVGLPASFDDIPEHLASLESAVRGSRWSDSERAILLLEGRLGVRLSAVDFALIGDRPPLPDDRSPDGLTLHLERLVMPDTHVDARTAYIDSLGLDDPSQTALSLVKLERASPDVVTALLQLDLLQACQLLGREGQCDKDIHDLVIEMAKIRIAFVLRLIAEEVGDRLHSPFRWEPLDGPAGGNTVRLGHPEAKLRKDLKLAKRALDLYREGRRSDPIEQSCDSVIARNSSELSVTVTTLNRSVSEKEAKLLLNSAEKVRAEKWLEELRAKHGNGLEDMLEHKIAHIERQLERLRQKLDAHVNIHGRKKRAGNRGPVPPLIRLMVAVRHAVAWTQLTPEYDTARKRHDRVKQAKLTGIETALAWMQRREGRCPWPSPHKDHASIVIRVFTILRFVFVDDDYMLPAELRSVTNPETGETEHFNSQADAQRVTGHRHSFDALISAHDRIGQPRSDVMRDETKLLGKALLSVLPKRQRVILAVMLQRFAAGFMPRRSSTKAS